MARDLRTLQEEQARLRQLCESPGWKWFIFQIEDQMSGRVTEVALNRPTGIDDLVGRSYDLGVVAGMRKALVVPESRLEELEGLIQNKTDELEEELRDANGRTDTAP